MTSVVGERSPRGRGKAALRGNYVVGQSIDALDTPALLLDIDRFDRNAASISGFLRGLRVDWRPHIKAIRSPVLAHRLLAAGARGVTCATLSEAEFMVEQGIGSVLIANQLGSLVKWERAAALEKRAEVIVAVDDGVHIELAASAAERNGVTVPLVVEVDVGMHRSGVVPGRHALALAAQIAGTDGLSFRGLMAWEGQVQEMAPPPAKERACRRALARLVATREAIEAAGIPVDIVSCGGTGTYTTAATVDGVTEIQAGGGCLMDRYYAERCHVGGLDFALTVLSTISSRPGRRRAVVDAGFKAMAQEPCLPIVLEPAGVTVVDLSAEHGELLLSPAVEGLPIGTRLEFVPGYSDATTFLHDTIVGVRERRVEGIYPIHIRRGVYEGGAAGSRVPASQTKKSVY